MSTLLIILWVFLECGILVVLSLVQTSCLFTCLSPSVIPHCLTCRWSQSADLQLSSCYHGNNRLFPAGGCAFVCFVYFCVFTVTLAVGVSELLGMLCLRTPLSGTSGRGKVHHGIVCSLFCANSQVRCHGHCQWQSCHGDQVQSLDVCCSLLHTW